MFFCRNENKKLELLYEKYKFLLLKISNDILKDIHLSEDIVQQTFIKVIENIDKFDDIESSKTRNFIAIICRNLAFNTYKKMKKEDYSFNDEILHTDNESSQELIEEIVISDIAVNIVKEEIMKLPVIYRDILVLEKVYGYNCKQIAKILDSTIDTVYKRRERAKNKLIEMLEKRGVINNGK